MKAFWLILVSVLLVVHPVVCGADDRTEDALEAEQAAMEEMVALAFADADDEQLPKPAAKSDSNADTDEQNSEGMDDVAELVSLVTEMNLSGADIEVSVIGSGQLVITGNEHDLGILEQLIKQLDEAPPANATASATNVEVLLTFPKSTTF